MRAKGTCITGQNLQRIIGSVGECVNVRSCVFGHAHVLKHIHKIFDEVKLIVMASVAEILNSV